VLETALLQGLPIDYHLEGSKTNAINQIGNTYPPVMAEKVFRLVAQTLKAFNFGLINADDEIDDLNVTLIKKGFDIIEHIVETPAAYIDLTSPPRSPRHPYRYLTEPVTSDVARTGLLSPWARRKID
jgi:DNA (cytosine-5)-methyltransferase 1